MIFRDFNVLHVAIFPDEADAPLIVNANAVLMLAIASQLFEPVTRHRRQVIQSLRGVDHHQLPKRLLLELLELPYPLAIEQALGGSRSKRFDHTPRI